MKKIIALCLIVCLSLSLSPFVANVNAYDWGLNRLVLQMTAAVAISHVVAVASFGNKNRENLPPELLVAGLFSLLFLKVVFLDEPGEPLSKDEKKKSIVEPTWRHNEGRLIMME
jgi:hypothetical protein